MSDDKPDSVPGSGAGDAAPTQEIPRIPNPAKTATSDKRAETSPNGAKKTVTSAPKTDGQNGSARSSAASSSKPATKADEPKPAATTTTDKSSVPATKQSASPPPSAKAETPAKDETSVKDEAPTQDEAPTKAETDKGRARTTPPPAKKAPAPPEPDTAPPAAKTEESAPAKRQVEPIGGPPGRPLTAADYARTTTPSAATTSVIPAVKEDLDPKKSAPAVTVEPAGEPGNSRRASLRLVRVEPWSVTKLAFTISVAMMIVAVVAVSIFWFVLDAVGVWGQINDSITSVLSDDTSTFDITDYLGFGRLFGLTLVLSAINVILMTALATIAAHLYNLASQLLGGFEVTFAEEQ